MKPYQLFKIKYLSGKSLNSDNSGQTPQQAKYEKTFVNVYTGELSSITDVDSKKYKRNKYFEDFQRIYSPLYQAKEVSILALVVCQDQYETITKFLNTISRKLKRKGVEKYGYVWVRDIGDKKFNKHYHLLLATSRIDKEQFNFIFKTKKTQGYEVQFMKSNKGLIRYIKKKELYGINRQRTYGRSRMFKRPR